MYRVYAVQLERGIHKFSREVSRVRRDKRLVANYIT